MDCVCYNLMNRLQNSLETLLSSMVQNRYNNGLPSTDDGEYQPNFNLLNENSSSSFNANLFFYIFMILLALVTISSFLGSRRRRIIGGNGSSLQ